MGVLTALSLSSASDVAPLVQTCCAAATVEMPSAALQMLCVVVQHCMLALKVMLRRATVLPANTWVTPSDHHARARFQ